MIPEDIVEWAHRALPPELRTRRRAARIEVGAGLLEMLRSRGTPPDEDATYPRVPWRTLLGIPLFERDDLGPWEWRVLDRWGDVIDRG